MKYCFICPGPVTENVLNGSTKLGGAEGQVAALSAVSVKSGHQVTFVYGDGSQQSAPSTIAGIRCLDVYPRWRKPSSLIKFWTALAQAAPDLIYARLPNDFLWLAALFCKWHHHSRFLYALANDRECNPWLAYPYHRLFHGFWYALALRWADVVAVQHSGQLELVRPYVKGQVVFIPNLIRSVAGEVRRYEETDIDALWVAQIRPEKQLGLYLDLAQALPHLRFAVVGEFKPAYNASQRQALVERMQAQNNVQFLGEQRFEDVIRLLKRSRVLVNSSSAEGFPNTMLEAWSVGVPVVSLQIDPGGVIEREGIGLVSHTLGQMILDVERLAATQSMNLDQGKRGLEYVRQNHTLAAVDRALEGILASRTRDITARQGSL